MCARANIQHNRAREYSTTFSSTHMHNFIVVSFNVFTTREAVVGSG